ncbi:ankyrin repeat-containing domain protein [Multifurca ochricompacta]|uniref:Ankyrin repeat-containing domain protein n=1 Tax=Multifurca ochricompacta TaxID=376703 RepID=A0AAD4M103_9AGAM|nr:ankyrin repeat-containing domain protein [Multifurca ochricompacta]
MEDTNTHEKQVPRVLDLRVTVSITSDPEVSFTRRLIPRGLRELVLQFYVAHELVLFDHSLELTMWVLDHGADINAKGNFFGYVLQAAAPKGDLEMVKWLLGHGADVNVEGGYYGYPLQVVADKGHVEIVKSLLDCGAGVNAEGGRYGYPLQAVADNRDVEIEKWLIEHGARINV